MNYFLNQVDVGSWEDFFDGGYQDAAWGFTEFHQNRAKGIQKGARLICWLLGRKAWCGVLEVAGELLSPDDSRVPSERSFPKLDGSYPVRFPVRALVVLSVDQAIKAFDPSVQHPSLFPAGVEQGAPGWNARLRRDLAPIHAEAGALLVDCLSRRARHMPLPYDADAAGPESAHINGEPERATRQILARRGQAAFRSALLHAYGEQCAISGCDVVDVLEAAHIVPHSDGGTSDVSNGLPLRADLHTLFDLGLISVEPETLTVILSERLRASEYGGLHGQRLRLPEADGNAPNKAALRELAKKRGSAAGD